MKILRNKDNIDINYLFYIMKGIQFDNTTHKRYWISEYSKIKIPLPPLDIQKQIVDTIIQKKNAIKKHYEEIAKHENDIQKEVCNVWNPKEE